MAAAKRTSKASDAALGGITLALIILTLYAITIIKNSTIFLLVLSNYLSAIPYIKGRIRLGIEVYIAAIILSLVVVPERLYTIAYAVTGLYPLVKLLCESRKLIEEFILKLLYYNISMVSLLIVYDAIMSTSMLNMIWTIGLKQVAVIIAAEAFFIVYDYIFSKFIKYINNKLIWKIS